MTGTIINRKTRIMAQQLGIKSPEDDARAKISNAIEWIQAKGGIEIVFENGQEAGWSNILTLPDNVHLTAQGDVCVQMLGNVVFSRFVRTASQGACEINGSFRWDARNLVSQVFIEARDAATLIVDGSTFVSTGADVTQTGPAGIRIGTGAGCIINQVAGHGIGNLVHWAGNGTAGPTSGRQTHTRLDNPAKSASVLLINHHTKDLHVYDIEQTAYAQNVVGGHCIALQGESLENPEPTITGLTIDSIRLTGRAGVGWEPDKANGATGDMIAIRSADGWSITDFVLRHGGEFGIDAVHGAENGYIGPGKGVALIEHMDGAAVVLGSSATREDGAGGAKLTQPARSVEVQGVELHDVGIDNARTPLGFSSIAGIRVLNAVDCMVRNNRITGVSGAPVYISNNPAYPVQRLTVEGNKSRNCGTTNLGGDPVWYGQVAAFGWDGELLTYSTGQPPPTIVTGLLNGVPFPAGAGGLR